MLTRRGVRPLVVAVCLASSVADAFAQRRSCSAPSLAQPAGYARAFQFNMVRPGVYQAVSTGVLEPANRPVVIVNDSDVVVVDPTASAAAACALIADIRNLTPKPIRTVINTHFHFDHSGGNEVFPADVQIIAHEYARQMIVSGTSTSGRSVEFIGSMVNPFVASLMRRVDTMANSARRDSLRQQAINWQQTLAAIPQTTRTPPTRTVVHELSIVHSPRQIRLLHVGRGHTAGDLVVFLPSDRIVITGDLLQSDIPYMGDGYFPEWVAALDSVKKLDFDVVIPGHQDPFTQRERIDFLQNYLRDLWSQASALYSAGVSPVDAAKQIDLRRHASYFMGAGRIGVDPFATRRIWDILDGKQ